MITRPTKAPEGLCRRHAPMPGMIEDGTDNGTSSISSGISSSISSGTSTGTRWPKTFDDDWCGEGEPTDPA